MLINGYSIVTKLITFDITQPGQNNHNDDKSGYKYNKRVVTRPEDPATRQRQPPKALFHLYHTRQLHLRTDRENHQSQVRNLTNLLEEEEDLQNSRRRSEDHPAKMHGYTGVSLDSPVAGMKGGDIDLEAGNGDMLYPGIGYGENQLRWGFIRKVYGILTAQILLTTLVSAVFVTYEPINNLLRDNSGFMLFLVFTPFVLLWPLHVYQQKHPLNFIFLGLFTASLSLTVGVTCANTEATIVLQALILTSAVVAALTGYTFWAAKKGKDFSFLGPILFTSLFILVLTSFIQMFFPIGSTASAIYGALGAIVFSGYIVYDTDNLIKRFTYDEYIWASVTLYLDVLNLFLTILRMLRESN